MYYLLVSFVVVLVGLFCYGSYVSFKDVFDEKGNVDKDKMVSSSFMLLILLFLIYSLVKIILA